MKKKLEAELMSIAHRILRIKDRSDAAVLLQETQNLYQKLSVLQFVDENFSHLQPTIGKIDLEREMEAAFEAKDKKAQNTNDEEAFAERTQQDDNSKIDEGDSQDIATDSVAEKDEDSKNDDSFEKENDIEETEEENEGENEPQDEEIVEEENADSDEEDSDEEEEESEEEESEEEESEEEEEEEEEESDDSDEEDDSVENEDEDNSDEDEDSDEEDDAEEDDDDSKEEDKVEVLETPAAEETTEENEELELPEASSSEESQVKTLEIGTAEAIANDEVLQDKTEFDKSDNSEKLFNPAFDWDFVAREENKPKLEEKTEDVVAEVEKPVAPATRQFTFDDLLGSSYKDPVFVTPADLERERLQTEERQISEAPAFKQEEVSKKEPIIIPTPKAYETPRPLSINDKLSKGIIVGLNDRIAFVKHLFGNSNEDYNRVLSQMLTFNTMEEAKEFIDEMVKPDYKNWEGKEDYEERFLEVISKKFS